METEIEIKFLFSADFEQELFNTIKSQQVISTKEQLLHNVYFDTSDRSLRKMDMGLRVRSCDNRSVQTIKTSGRVIGGLHQRPEYNEPIEGGRPELARFNSKIWPDECDIKALENELVPIFSTDFTRQTWLLEMSEATLIEVAYDRGFIEAKQDKKDICEIELELIKGDEKQLFILAEQIALLPQVRLSNVSKAQRGYMLGDQTEFVVKPLLESPLLPSMSIAQALMTNIQHGLRHIQYHENCYLESYQDAALNELVVGIKFVHQNLSLFKDHSPMLLKAPWIEGLHWLARSFSWLETPL
ncbi:inorganic triphosphatase [Psychromonas sp. MME1]|uniref:CYTH domain-containing protein n=1 Tax=Psychromonas sp. MME1 TaxID=3231032 RepID=UPI0034E287FA